MLRFVVVFVAFLSSKTKDVTGYVDLIIKRSAHFEIGFPYNLGTSTKVRFLSNLSAWATSGYLIEQSHIILIIYLKAQTSATLTNQVLLNKTDVSYSTDRDEKKPRI